MEAWESLVDCPFEQEFDECLKKFEITCLPWPMFVDNINQTWLIPYKERFVKAWKNKVMHLENTTTNRYENCKFLLLLGFKIEWIKIIVFVYLLVYLYTRLSLLIGP